MTTTYPEAIKTAVELAQSDYDAFWFARSVLERKLTLTLENDAEDYPIDTYVVNGGDLWLIQINEGGKVVANYVGKTQELVLFVNEENTSLADEDQLEYFAHELRQTVGSAIQVVLGTSVSPEWLRTNKNIELYWKQTLRFTQAWFSAFESAEKDHNEFFDTLVDKA